MRSQRSRQGRGPSWGWGADFRFQWRAAAKCMIVAREYDHNRGAFFPCEDEPSDLSPQSLYEIARDSGPAALLRLARGEEASSRHWVIVVESEGRGYSPFEEYPDLFLRLATLGKELRNGKKSRVTHDLILEWVRQFGLLGAWPPVILPQVVGGPSDVAVQSLEPVEVFVAEAIRASFLLDLYDELIGLDAQALRQRFQWQHEPVGMSLIVVGDPLFGKVLSPVARWHAHRHEWKDQEYLRLGLAYLANTVGGYLSPLHGHGLHDVSPQIAEIRFVPYGDEERAPIWEVIRCWSCTTLLSALYVQFLDLICRKRRAMLCNWCHRWFSPRRGTAQFCSPRCRQHAHYHLKRKAALELYRLGLPTSEVARRLGTAESKVIKWINDMQKSMGRRETQ